jgi:hypothetical protein
MKLNTMFTIAAILLIFVAIVSLFVPPAMLGTTDASAAFEGKLGGVTWLSLGVMAWLVRNAEASKTRDSVVLGYTILFALLAVVSVYGSFLDMPTAKISWGPALIWALLAVGFFMAGKASMSTSAS